VHLGILRLLVAISLGRVRATGLDALPLASDRELLPGVGENLADVDLVVVRFPVLEVHPPVSIVFELIAELLSKFQLVIPSLVFVTEATGPLAWSRTPWITDVEKLKKVRSLHVLNSQ
jgi:hypothetical protein